MALVPPGFFDMVVAIGFQGEDEKPRWGASGFLYGDHVEETNYRVALVTNRHVFADQNIAHLRFNGKAGGAAQEHAIPLRDEHGNPYWFAHPDREIDIGVIGINLGALDELGIEFKIFQSQNHAADRSKCLELGLAEGDGVYVLGFPMGIVGAERNLVIVRQGCIARLSDFTAGSTKSFLIDAPVYPGNSGGPVVTKPEITAIHGTKSQNASYLIGMITSYLPYEDVAVSVQTGRPRVTFSENSGLAHVISVDMIRETIQAYYESVKTSVTPTPTTPPP